PYEGSMKDCVATAPTPASAQATFEPTENQCDCTATPSSPVCGSRATIEKVCAGRSGRGAASSVAVSPRTRRASPLPCCATALRAFNAHSSAADASAVVKINVNIRLIFPPRLQDKI